MNEYEKTNSTRITSVNQRRLARRERRRIQRRNRFIAILSAGILTGSLVLALANKIESSKPPLVMPEDYVQITVRENVERGDTLTGIATRYYDPEVYDSYYGSVNNYVDAIADTNDIYKDHINPYQTLTVPVFVEEENIYLMQINKLEDQIKSLPVWVDYTVEYGDTVLALAYKGAGTTNEAYEIKDRIIAKNGLNNSILRDGMVIQIVNPEIGTLKAEIARLKDLLQESAQVEPTTEKSY